MTPYGAPFKLTLYGSEGAPCRCHHRRELYIIGTVAGVLCKVVAIAPVSSADDPLGAGPSTPTRS